MKKQLWSLRKQWIKLWRLHWFKRVKKSARLCAEQMLHNLPQSSCLKKFSLSIVHSRERDDTNRGLVRMRVASTRRGSTCQCCLRMLRALSLPSSTYSPRYRGELCKKGTGGGWRPLAFGPWLSCLVHSICLFWSFQ